MLRRRIKYLRYIDFFQISPYLAAITGQNAGADVDRSGRIEARTGLRMMPTFPRSSLSFRTAGGNSGLIAQMVGTMVLIRLAKVAMIASLAANAFIVAYDNIVDYQSNYEFVRHVLSMDTTFHGNALMHRAISNESIWSLAYALIIAMEGSTALLLVVGALVLLSRLRAPAEVFNRSKVWAVAGLTVGFGLWFFGFMVIAGEYFAMWQSKIWNGQDAAFRIATVIPWSAGFRQLARRRA
jgi:predicted small integral membrane protein